MCHSALLQPPEEDEDPLVVAQRRREAEELAKQQAAEFKPFDPLIDAALKVWLGRLRYACDISLSASLLLPKLGLLVRMVCRDIAACRLALAICQSQVLDKSTPACGGC